MATFWMMVLAIVTANMFMMVIAFAMLTSKKFLKWYCKKVAKMVEVMEEL